MSTYSHGTTPTSSSLGTAAPIAGRLRLVPLAEGLPCLCPVDPSRRGHRGKRRQRRLSIFSSGPRASRSRSTATAATTRSRTSSIGTPAAADRRPRQRHDPGLPAATTTSTAVRGNDEVDGGDGDDQVRGGVGDDEIWGDHYKDPGADLLDGGPGTDTTEEWGIPRPRPPAARDVTLDGAANDGRPGEGDNVVGIERINMYVVGDFMGTEGPDEIKIVNPGNEGPSSLIGLGGNDILVGDDFDDTVDGGAGNDTRRGRPRQRAVTGGPGRDTIYGDATSSHCSWYSCRSRWGTTRSRRATASRTTSTAGSGPTPRSSTRSTSSPTARRQPGQSRSRPSTPAAQGASRSPSR